DTAEAEHCSNKCDDQQGYDQVEHGGWTPCLERYPVFTRRPSSSRSWPPSMPASVAATAPNSRAMKLQNEKYAPAFANLSAADFTASRLCVSTVATRCSAWSAGSPVRADTT